MHEYVRLNCTQSWDHVRQLIWRNRRVLNARNPLYSRNMGDICTRKGR